MCFSFAALSDKDNKGPRLVVLAPSDRVPIDWDEALFLDRYYIEINKTDVSSCFRYFINVSNIMVV